MKKLCQTDGCNKFAQSRGLCHNHYMHVYRQENLDKFKNINKTYYEKNKEQILIKQSAYNKINSEHRKLVNKEWYIKNADTVKKRSSEWVKNNKEKHNKNGAEWARRNPEIVNAKTKRYYGKYPDKSNARHAKYKSKKLQAIPKWFNELDEFVIKEAHALVRLRTKLIGIKWHVDHIVPLQSKLVCGLHCAANTQVIPAFTNIQKLNRYWPNMPV